MRAWDSAFRSSDPTTLRAARRKLTAGIKRAKNNYALKIQGYFSPPSTPGALGVLRGRILSLRLYTLLTHDCTVHYVELQSIQGKQRRWLWTFACKSPHHHHQESTPTSLVLAEAEAGGTGSLSSLLLLQVCCGENLHLLHHRVAQQLHGSCSGWLNYSVFFLKLLFIILFNLT